MNYFNKLLNRSQEEKPEENDEATENKPEKLKQVEAGNYGVSRLNHAFEELEQETWISADLSFKHTEYDKSDFTIGEKVKVTFNCGHEDFNQSFIAKVSSISSRTLSLKKVIKND